MPMIYWKALRRKSYISNSIFHLCISGLKDRSKDRLQLFRSIILKKVINLFTSPLIALLFNYFNKCYSQFTDYSGTFSLFLISQLLTTSELNTDKEKISVKFDIFID